MIDRKELKTEARAAMKETKPHPFWVTMAVTAILLVLQVLSLNLSGDLDAIRTMYAKALEGQFVYVPSAGSGGLFPWLLTMVMDLMVMVVGVGYSLYALRIRRRENPGVGDVFDAFGIFGRSVVAGILKNILIMLWSLVILLPVYFLLAMVLTATGGDALAAGDVNAVLASMDQWSLPVMAVISVLQVIAMIVASYRYRMTGFLVVDHPEFSPSQCLTVSRMAMRGRKWELFKLDLSFLGWLVLSLIPFVELWVRPYRYTAVAGWYDRIFPSFQEQMRAQWAQRMANPAPRFRGGWSVPGQGKDEDDPDDEDPDDPDGRWM